VGRSARISLWANCGCVLHVRSFVMSGDNPFEVSTSAIGDRSPRERDVMSAEVTTRTIEMLSQTRPWVQLIGVLMWIATVILAICSIVMIVLSFMGPNPNPVVGGMGVIYLLVILVYWAFAKSLTSYASRINALKASESVADLEDALEAQKGFWRLAGIITVVFLLLYVVILVFAFSGAMFLGNAFRR
jgi:hypothetical protein